MADTSNSNLLAVRLVTPDRLLLDATAEAVELPALTGYMETLYGAVANDASSIYFTVAWSAGNVPPGTASVVRICK